MTALVRAAPARWCSTPTRSSPFRARSTSCARSPAGGRWCSRPHPGEFRTLFPDARAGARARSLGGGRGRGRASRARRVLLKGVPTVVARAGRAPLTVAAGNPGLATGGSGDVLSGLVGTALAQGLAPEIAAALRRPGARPRRRPRGPPRRPRARSGPWTWSRRCPISGASGRCSAWRRRSPRPPMLLELARPQTV